MKLLISDYEGETATIFASNAVFRECLACAPEGGHQQWTQHICETINTTGLRLGWREVGDRTLTTVEDVDGDSCGFTLATVACHLLKEKPPIRLIDGTLAMRFSGGLKRRLGAISDTLVCDI
jgi:hypothetical protein